MPDVRKEKTGMIHENNLEMLDFAEACLKIGARVEGRPVRWMELDETDWKILQLLLTKPVVGGKSASDESKPLQRLASFAEAVVKWYGTQKETNHDSRPTESEQVR